MATERYINLVTSEHRDKPKFIATVLATTDPFAELQTQLESLPPRYDLATARGEQLDTIGLWVGAFREVVAPPKDYYVDPGYVEVGYFVDDDPFEGTILLDDDTYRLLIKAKIGANHWDGSLGSTKAIFETVFGPNSQVFIQDNQDMSMRVGVVGAPLPPVFQALLTQGHIPLKPEGVRVAFVMSTVEGSPLFGFDMDNQLISGFDTGAWGRVF